MFIWNPPEVTPFIVPLTVKPPVAVAPPTKQGLEEVKFRFVMLRLLPLFWVSVRVKSKTGELEAELIRAAVQFPLMLLELEPQPAKLTAIASVQIVQIDFMRDSTPRKDNGFLGMAFARKRDIGLFPLGTGKHTVVFQP
jgi:hypothetical protein